MLHSLLTSAKDGGEWSVPRHGRLPPGENTLSTEQETGQLDIKIYLLLLLLFLILLLQMCCHSVAAVLTTVQTKQIRINIHKRNNTKTQYRQ